MAVKWYCRQWDKRDISTVFKVFRAIAPRPVFFTGTIACGESLLSSQGLWFHVKLEWMSNTCDKAVEKAFVRHRELLKFHAETENSEETSYATEVDQMCFLPSILLCRT